MGQQNADIPTAPPGNPAAPGFLIPDAVSLVVACMSGSEVPDGDIAPLLRDVHAALLDVARDADALAGKAGGQLPQLKGAGELPSIPMPALAESQEPADIRAAATLREIGVEFTQLHIAPAPPASAVHPAPAEGRQQESAPGRGKKRAASGKSAKSGTEPSAEQAGPAVQSQGSLALDLVPEPSAAPRKKARSVARKAVESGSVPVAPVQAKKARTSKAALRLPKGLESIEDALRTDIIVCLEDGRRVRDLGAHLQSIGMTPDGYRHKWGLPPEYPMQSPQTIMRRGSTFEVDLATGKRIPVR